MPLYLLIHITLKCNRDCFGCYQKREAFYLQDCPDLSLNDFEGILASFKQRLFYKPHIHLFGGEPLLHPEFPGFLDICQKYSYAPTLTTNGDYLNTYAEILKRSSIAQLNVSLSKPPNDLSNSETADATLKPIEFLTEKPKKIINLNFTLRPDNYHLLIDTVLFFNRKFKKGRIDTFTCQHFMSGMKPLNIKERKTINVSTVIKQIRELEKIRLNFKLLFLPHIRLKDIYRYYYSGDKFLNRCYVPWAGLSIYPNLTVTMGGGVLGCNKVAGHLGSESILKIWHSEKLNNFRNHLLDHGLEEICNRCCHKLYY